MQCLFCLFYEYRRDDFFDYAKVVTQPTIGQRATSILSTKKPKSGAQKREVFTLPVLFVHIGRRLVKIIAIKSLFSITKLLIFLYRKTFTFKLNNVSLHEITRKNHFTVTIHPKQTLHIHPDTISIGKGWNDVLCGYTKAKYRQI